MTIEDPTAIPETAADIDEYLAEAEQSWDRSDADRAETLYSAVISSQYSGPQRGLVLYRLALIYLNRGDADEAYRRLLASDHPAAAELMRSIDNATPDDAVDPSRVPENAEEADSYWRQAVAAFDSNDMATALALFGALVQCPALPPGTMAVMQIRYAITLHRQGRDDEAGQWAQAALPNAATDADQAEARQLLRQLGVQVTDDNPYDTEGSRALIAGIEAYQRGDTAAANSSLETARASDTSTTEDKGRAAFYLGSIAYHARDFDTARTYLHEARDSGPAAERVWASEMLEWRWQEPAAP